MRRLMIGIVILAMLGGLYYLYNDKAADIPTVSSRNAATTSTAPDSRNTDQPLSTIVAEDLDTPWEIVFLPDESMLVTERAGKVVHINKEGKKRTIATFPEVREVGEGGLMGMTLHPDFEENKYLYLYYTYSGEENNTLNRVVRMKFEDNILSDEKIMVDAIPGASNHNGGRIAFGPDNFLYITTGDAENPSQAQDTNSLAGKILRVTDEGDPAPTNPFDNEVYSYGHRNPQGLAWDDNDRLWATEHGRSGVQSGLDELNLIVRGANYGWPDIQGDDTREGMVAPVIHSGTNATWAPAGAAIHNNSLFFAGLRGQALYEADISGNEISEVREHLKDEYGRIRAVVTGPDRMLYISTSNNDGRGDPQPKDDKIVKINPAKLKQ